MEISKIMSYIDHTLLKPEASWNDIEKLCGEALKYGTASVCVPPSYVRRIAGTFGDKLNICTVVGFPFGYSATAAKAAEVEAAIADGASEIDMVINIGDAKNGDFDKITAEIKALKRVAGEHILKVIIETCYLTEEEKIELCGCVTKAGADYIKTSTGLGPAGATMEDILLFKKHIGENVKIKAAGGVRTIEDMAAFIEAGCSRIGTSSAAKLAEGGEAGSY